MGLDERSFCPTFRPSRAEFSRPFCEYVQEVCRKNPDIAMFKVVPPKGWAPRKGAFPKLEDLRIDTPIKQHAFGTGGAFRSILEEQRGLSAADFKKLAYSGSHNTPPKGHRQDDLLERAFWSSVTINPPLYGADNPTSLFDAQLDYGWNLNKLEDLLSKYNVAPIPGVTTPMVYFGMWKSFFSWHVEDVDLYSINYLHFGAPKVWYCVSPKDRVKFENMAKGLFPELYNICPAFLRHKDILLSPKTLRNHHIEYVQAKQEAGEFVVLNAGAYHSGFNLGFNCAEAVNFATEDWLATGNEATQCTCDALPDHVTLDMKIFKRGHRVSQRIKAALQKAESESENSESGGEEDDEDSDSEVEGSDSEEEESGAAEASSSDAEDPEEAGVQKAASRRRRVAANPSRRTPKSRSLNELHSRPAKPPPKRRPPQPKAAVRKASPPKQTLTRTLAIKQLSKAAARRGTAASPAKPPPKAQPKPAAAKPAATGAKAKAKRGTSAVSPAPPRRSPHSNSAVAKLAAARGHGSKRLAGVQPSAVEPISTPRVKRQRTSQGGAEAAKKPAASAEATRVEDENSSSVRRAYEWVRSLMASTSNAHPNGRLIPGSQSASNMYSPSGLDTDGEALYAVVAREEQTKERCFYLVQKVQKKAKRPQDVTVRWLQAGEDQIFRPTAETWEEAAEALVPVRSQPCHVRGKHMPPGYRLLAQPLEQILGGKAEE